MAFIKFKRISIEAAAALSSCAISIAATQAAPQTASSVPPPIAIDACAAHPWYLPFGNGESDKLAPIGETRIAELVRRWKIDQGPVLATSLGTQENLTAARLAFVVGRLVALGIPPSDIWERHATKNSDPDFADVVEISLSNEGASCKAHLRSDRVKWLLGHCAAGQIGACRAQLEALEIE